MNNCCDSFCKGCQYFSTYLKNCDYSELEGHLRGCPPGKGCTKKKKGRKKVVKNPLGIKRKKEPEKPTRIRRPDANPGGKPLQEYPERMQRYLDGMTVKEMAEAEGCTEMNIRNFLRRRNLGPN